MTATQGDRMTAHDFTGEISFTSSFEHEISADPYCALDFSDTGDPTDVALEARVLASHWHGGQASALYAFASSGHLDADACIAELSRCDVDESRDALLAFFEGLKPRKRLAPFSTCEPSCRPGTCEEWPSR